VGPFLSKHVHAVTETLSGFDRLVLRGTSRLLANRAGMMRHLWTVRVLLKDFSNYAGAMTRQLREASEALTRQTARPIRLLASSAASKERIAREIARTDNITQGLICILEAAEPCRSYQVVHHHLLLRPSQQVSAPLSLPRPSSLRLHACAHPDLVPVLDPNLSQWPRVAVALDGQ
jgi:hypothetical protein